MWTKPCTEPIYMFVLFHSATNIVLRYYRHCLPLGLHLLNVLNRCSKPQYFTCTMQASKLPASGLLPRPKSPAPRTAAPRPSPAPSLPTPCTCLPAVRHSRGLPQTHPAPEPAPPPAPPAAPMATPHPVPLGALAAAPAPVATAAAAAAAAAAAKTAVAASTVAASDTGHAGRMRTADPPL
jgi:hypothetical protein